MVNMRVTEKAGQYINDKGHGGNMQLANTVGQSAFVSGTGSGRLTEGEVGEPYAG